MADLWDLFGKDEPFRDLVFPEPARREYIFVGRPVAIAFAATFILAVVWAAAATWAFAFRDGLISKMVSRQAELRYEYEDRLRDFRGRLDDVTDKQVIDQEIYDERIMDLLKRQVQLEDRQSMVDSLIRQANMPVGGPIVASDAASVSVFTPPGTPPASGVSISRPPAAPLLPSNLGSPRLPPHFSSDKYSLGERILRAKRFADAMDQRHLTTLAGLSQHARRNASLLKGVIAEVGLDADTLIGVNKRPAQGGPLLGLDQARTDPFTRSALTTQLDLTTLERLRRTVDSLPLRRPGLDSAITSGFGVRTDPFTRGLALHSGIDFAQPEGMPVFPTGAGRVTTADYTGGYGKMVEVDHGNGVVTRYAHLSEIDVRPGAIVTVDTQIGRVGSTGRSTGSHLHYETRIGGDAVNPTRFLRAADLLAEIR
ncbi:M23 family metallopeptidase [Chelatococcus asaccharovorans]|uniref:Peptidase M23-like protein n=1 Tax=Chelatococcus asaccharovorans TaxID=28210 RepID=A0A2V3UEE4_9HYPH|nr:M23 family metallopeptidase [Chelatococcus asaccharovorans]MBS7703544.1 M23 family metallopeptidase [Chelatococcus asaccharovorans]PXW61886.1 peptidase M23-like protein [Chelatococcus asaccharovorans]CAH1670213.1 Peptidase M23-like protein [Chelatococcus asaccharovorans]CAH1678351.1 Peptidase M23-like protein [Chelatococcus asaccharovorans]